MSDYNLTLEDLEEGKLYSRRSASPYVVFKMIDNSLFTVDNNTRAVIVKGDRFKEIKKEAEFKEVFILSNGGDLLFTVQGGDKSYFKRQEYKIENGKLLTRDL